MAFQSTSLSRGKTILQKAGCRCSILSIHFPLTREDRRRPDLNRLYLPFNPLPSHEGRRETHPNHYLTESFNPLPSHEGRRPPAQCPVRWILSIHFPLTREDVPAYSPGRTPICFQSTSLSRGKTVIRRVVL